MSTTVYVNPTVISWIQNQLSYKTGLSVSVEQEHHELSSTVTYKFYSTKNLFLGSTECSFSPTLGPVIFGSSTACATSREFKEVLNTIEKEYQRIFNNYEFFH